MALPWRDLPSFPLREPPLQQVPGFEGISQAYHPHSVTALQRPSLIGGRAAHRVRGRLRQGRLPLLGGREVRASRPLQRRAHRGKAEQPQRAHWAGMEGGSAWLEPGVGAEVGAVGQSEVRSAGARPSQAWGPGELRGAAAAGTADLGCTDGSRGGVCEPSQEKMLSQDTTESQNLPALHPHAASESSIPVTKRLKCHLRSVQPVSVCV